jgi:hypothetical protein
MAQIKGNPAYWSEVFPQELIPQILAMVLSVWNDLPKRSRKELEIRTTRRFLSALIHDKNTRKEVPVRISRECVEDDLRTGRQLGRIDLCFIPPNSCHEQVYFAFECKRLNVRYPERTSSLASEYVKGGMIRFINSKYASILHRGGMIGYVLDGNTTSAIKGVNRNVKRCRIKLKMKAPRELSECSILPPGNPAKETIHHLTNRKFIIYHVFLRR